MRDPFRKQADVQQPLPQQGNGDGVIEFAKALGDLKAKGMQVNEITPAEQKRMFEKVRPVYEKNAATIGADAINTVVDALKKARGG